MKKRLLTIAVCVLLVFASLCGCNRIPGEGAGTSTGGDKTGAIVSDTLKNEITRGDLPDDVVIKIGDFEVKKPEYEFFFKNIQKSYMQQTGEDAVDMESDDFKNKFRDEIFSFFISNAATYSYADSLGIDTKNIDQAKVDELTQYFTTMYSLYYGVNLTDIYGDMLPYIMKVSVLSDECINAKVSDDEINDYVTNNVFSAKNILIKTVDDENNPLDEATIATKEALAKEIYDKAIAGDDFDALIKEYGEDPGMESNPDGYTFGTGEMVDEFYNGTKALEVNAISEPIKSTYGYHIIKRLPLILTDEEKATKRLDYAYAILEARGEADKVQNDITALGETLPIVCGKPFDEISFETYKAELEAEIAKEAEEAAKNAAEEAANNPEANAAEGAESADGTAEAPVTNDTEETAE